MSAISGFSSRLLQPAKFIFMIDLSQGVGTVKGSWAHAQVIILWNPPRIFPQIFPPILSSQASLLYLYWHVNLFPPKKSYKRGNNSLILSLLPYFYFPTGQISYLVLTIFCCKPRVSIRGLAKGVGTKSVIIGVAPEQRWAGRHSGRMYLWWGEWVGTCHSCLW